MPITSSDSVHRLDLGPAGGPPHLLLHGGAGPHSMVPFATMLAERRGARVVVPTHPGFAGTSRPDDLGSIRDLARLYQRLLDDLGLEGVTVLGNSIGGWIAAELALLASPRIASVILLDAVGLDVADHPVADVTGLTAEQLSALSFHDPSRFPRDPSRPGPDVGALAAYTGMRMTDPALRDRLARLDRPVRVIWGESDGIVTPEYGRAYADAIPGAVLTLLPETGHLPQLEAPDRLLAAI